MVNSSQRLTV